MDARMLELVTAVIVTYRGDDVLEKCMASLRETCGTALRIVVVDNSPSAATRGLVERHPNAVYVESPGNPGFAGGNNAAIPFCDRKYILLLNNDTVVRSAASIASLVEFMESHPECGVSQGSIVLPSVGGVAGGCGSFLTPFGFQYARGFGIPLDTPGVNRPVRCFSVMGAFMMFPKEILEETGGFLFYGHFGSYYEESDFCHRAWLAGREVWYVPTEPIEHMCGHTAGMFARADIMRRYIRNSFFSLLVNLGVFWRVPIVTCYAAVVFMYGVMQLLRGDRAVGRSAIGVPADIFRRRAEVAAARRGLNRKVSDLRVFLRVLRLPPVSYLLRSLRANIR